MVTPQDVLVRAHDLLGEYGICRGAYALDGNGNSTVNDQISQSYCSVGAIARAARDLGAARGMGTMNNACSELRKHIDTLAEGSDALTFWNDELATDEEILATFRKAAGLPEPTKPVDELSEASESILVAA